MRKFYILLSIALGISVAKAQNFTAGNIVVVRAGDGTTTLANNVATDMALQEYSSITPGSALKTVTLSLTIGGLSTSEGNLNRSTDGRYLNLIGYPESSKGTASSAYGVYTIPKYITRVDNTGTADMSTVTDVTKNANTYPYPNGNGVARSAVSFDGSKFYFTVQNNHLISLGTTTLGSSTTNGNFVGDERVDYTSSYRTIQMFKGRIYTVIAFGNIGYLSGTNNPPTTEVGTSNNVIISNGSNANALTLLDIDNNSTNGFLNSGYDIMYVSFLDAGVRKYQWDGSAWQSKGTITPGGVNAQGITATLSSTGKPVIFVTGPLVANNKIYRIVDNSTDHSATWSTAAATVTELASAGANYVFKGIAFSPEANATAESATPIIDQTALPVTIKSFSGSAQNNSVQLNWATSSEVNFKEFVIERSDDGVSFTPVATIASKNMAGGSTYTAQDNTPISGTAYYRLKSVDQDGSVEYFDKIVNVRSGIQASAATILFPNPTSGPVTVQHKESKVGGWIAVSDISGNKVASFKIAKGTLQTTIDVTNLNSGTYVVSVGVDNESGSVFKLIKK